MAYSPVSIQRSPMFMSSSSYGTCSGTASSRAFADESAYALYCASSLFSMSISSMQPRTCLSFAMTFPAIKVPLSSHERDNGLQNISPLKEEIISWMSRRVAPQMQSMLTRPKKLRLLERASAGVSTTSVSSRLKATGSRMMSDLVISVPFCVSMVNTSVPRASSMKKSRLSLSWKCPHLAIKVSYRVLRHSRSSGYSVISSLSLSERLKYTSRMGRQSLARSMLRLSAARGSKSTAVSL